MPENRDHWKPGAQGRITVFVAQLGSRMHYAVPIAFDQVGMLTKLVTDITADAWIARLAGRLPERIQPRFLRRLTGRVPTGLPRTKVLQYPVFGLGIGILRKIAVSLGKIDQAYVWIGRAFAKRAARALPPGTSVIYGFNGASLELLRAPPAGQALKILEQTMAPRLVEDRLLREADSAFPGWGEASASESDFDRPTLYQREADEWAAADVIVCGSRFVVDGIAEAKGPVEKCVVIPYGIDACSFPGRVRKLSPDRPINVLVVGAVTLRKGAPLVYEAASILAKEAHVRMVGAIQVPLEAERKLRRHVDLAGPVPRSEMRAQFDWADVFLLPTYCEGSATVTYEAMASGLPQIVTPNAGSYVADGRQGKIVPVGDANAIATAVRAYAANPTAYRQASQMALESIQALSVARYRDRLVELVTTHTASLGTSGVDR